MIFFSARNSFCKTARTHDGLGEIVHCFSESVHSRGVSVLFKKNSKIEIINHYKSVDGRRFLINIKYNDQQLTLLNVYAPNNEKYRIDFFKRVITWIN